MANEKEELEPGALIKDKIYHWKRMFRLILIGVLISNLNNIMESPFLKVVFSVSGLVLILLAIIPLRGFEKAVERELFAEEKIRELDSIERLFRNKNE